jgi:head-tail adaptor
VTAPAAGSLDERVQFEARAPIAPDAWGHAQAESWSVLFSRWARFRPEFGREQIAAGRMESTRSGVLTVRADSQTRTLTADHRATFLTGPNAGARAQIRSVIAMREMIELTLEIGAAT